MDEILNALNYVLSRSGDRLQRYIDTKDDKYMEECRIYLDVANIYMYNLRKDNDGKPSIRN
jgi:hypothetical protein